MDMLQGKHFSITDPKGVSTVIYQIYKTKKEFLKEYPKYTVERLECSEEIRGESRRKTFYVDDPQPQGNQLAILSFAGDKVIINSGVLIDDEVRIGKSPSAFKFDTLYSEEEQELKPRLYFDEKENKVKGKCKLKPNKSYFAFEVRGE